MLCSHGLLELLCEEGTTENSQPCMENTKAIVLAEDTNVTFNKQHEVEFPRELIHVVQMMIS